MKNAIIVHGSQGREEWYDLSYPSASNSHWYPWLQKQLIIRDYLVATPEMPRPFLPDYSKWRREFERFDIKSDTTLIGHSCGGGFLVRWLSENVQCRVNKVVLVAPWLDPLRERTDDFFDFTIDRDIAERTKRLTIFHSDNDVPTIQTSVDLLRESLKNFRFREFQGMGHFCYRDTQRYDFPELLDELVGDN